MTYHVVIVSTDVVFSRMLDLELTQCGLRVCSLTAGENFFDATVVLLDLDSIGAVPDGNYQTMIGFTKSSALAADEIRRRCTLILHRPFEMQVLRKEVLSCIGVCEQEGQNLTLEILQNPIKNNRISLKLQGNILTCAAKSISLSPKECAVMECLLASAGQPVTRQMLASKIGESSANKTDVYICYLRKKFEDAFGMRLISTVRGEGYLIS